MRLSVNDTELYFDAEGAALLPGGPAMRERPAVLALHGDLASTTPTSSLPSRP